ncbi:hypothetical protein VHEMI07573 [[Torrubiella] hemipterigena]|uniref:Luciferase domain-containing protein n=1 Tax=[Torrubiella] hemipterigena TaxID=1531966 RepID=A0A0A1TLW7_9HYPO|nr:hypothetical protein VHEMI07573 [[Torrubiella] hemipterigena]
MHRSLISIADFFSTRPLVSATAVASIPLLAIIIPAYRGFLALGPGGLPYNFIGFTIQAVGLLFAHRDTTSADTVRTAPANHQNARTRYLPDLTPRKTPRPLIPGYSAPHRQASQQGDETLVATLNGYLASLAESNAGLVIKGSGLELSTYPALWTVEEETPAHVLKTTGGEIAHVHPEGSAHMVLSLADAAEVLEKGWGEMHPLAGRVGRLPISYIMIYAPRNDTEVLVWKMMADAAVAYVSA